jgi:putative nucleotidyltransferase-like protein
MTSNEDMVRRALCNPEFLPSLTLGEWDLFIRQARSAGVLARIHALMEQNDLLERIPAAPRTHLEAARVLARSQERVIRWEVYCIHRALSEVGTEFVLLKGAAYVLSEMPFAQGRMQSDVDILVPRSKLKIVESALLSHGWVGMKLEEYDQRYYRQWSHELPPLYHPNRNTVLDVHHNILPETGRLHPDPVKLLQAAEPIPGTSHKRLCPEDMILHSAAHMFQDGDLELGLRGLADVDGLLRVCGMRPDFWNTLLQRAPELELDRPLYYALRYADFFLKTPVPEHVKSACRKWKPPAPVLRLMDRLVSRALVPRHSSTASLRTLSARRLLYIKAHWLRMPPLLLARHLMHQSLRGLKKKDQ